MSPYLLVINRWLLTIIRATASKKLLRHYLKEKHTLQSKTLPSLWSDVEQESMKVCATTERQESTILDLWISNTKFGFLIRLTQNRRGRLEKKKKINSLIIIFDSILKVLQTQITATHEAGQLSKRISYQLET